MFNGAVISKRKKRHVKGPLRVFTTGDGNLTVLFLNLR
jgi:hypothetical protein